MTAAFDPLLAIRTLLSQQVRFVVIGGVAGALWGSPSVTMDLDICHERSPENERSLAAALRTLNATLRGVPAGLPFQLDERTIRMGDSFTFDTIAGALDCLGTPSGTKGYGDLREHAEEIDLQEGVRVAVCSLADLVRMKRAAGRPKDRIEIEILSALIEERRPR